MNRQARLAALGAAFVFLVEATQRAQHQAAKAKLERRLEAAIAKAFRAQGKAFVKRLAAVRGEFREALRKEDLDPIWRATAAQTAGLFEKPIGTVMVDAFKAAARVVLADAVKAIKAGKTTAPKQVGISFELANPRATNWLKGRAAERVTLIDETTKKEIGGIVQAGIEQGLSYDKVAKSISDRFEQFAVGKPQEHIKSRAHLVAVTEVGEAYTESTLQMGQLLEDAGVPQEKSWLTSGDDRVSDGCRNNEHAGWIPLKDDFPSGHQRPLRFPGCRCDLLVQPSGLSDAGGGRGGGGRRPPTGGGGDGGDRPPERLATAKELNRFLKAGGRPKEVNVGELPEDWQQAIGSQTPWVKLSRYTIRKNRKNHPDLPSSIYHQIPNLIDSAAIVVKDREKSLALMKVGDRSYYAAIKSNAAGDKSYLSSLRRADARDIRRLKRWVDNGRGELIKGEFQEKGPHRRDRRVSL